MRVERGGLCKGTRKRLRSAWSEARWGKPGEERRIGEAPVWGRAGGVGRPPVWGMGLEGGWEVGVVGARE